MITAVLEIYNNEKPSFGEPGFSIATQDASLMDYSIAAIPTVYNKRRYRSRLEARWACFFDYCAWPFEYEPIDFGTWSPDFALFHIGGTPVYVEVKPINDFDKVVAEKIGRAALMQPSPPTVMLVGSRPHLEDTWEHGRIGWLFCPMSKRGWQECFIGKGHLFADIFVKDDPDFTKTIIWQDDISKMGFDWFGSRWDWAANEVQWIPKKRSPLCTNAWESDDPQRGWERS